jgi:hypothetical protein
MKTERKTLWSEFVAKHPSTTIRFALVLSFNIPLRTTKVHRPSDEKTLGGTQEATQLPLSTDSGTHCRAIPHEDGDLSVFWSTEPPDGCGKSENATDPAPRPVGSFPTGCPYDLPIWIDIRWSAADRHG